MSCVEFIFAEFGEERVNNGGSSFEGETIIDPSYRTFKEHFPEASFTLYTDRLRVNLPHDVAQIVVEPFFDAEHYRWGSRCNDYYKVYGLLHSCADVSIALDSDMYAFSGEVKTLVPLTQRFGMCVPPNPRTQVRRDGAIGLDADYELDEDESRGNAACVNMSPLSVSKRGRGGPFRCLLVNYLKLLQEHPARGPLVMWRAMWKTGVHPLVLPPQWCVCSNGVGGPDILLNNSENEIVLHVGHPEVAEAYNISSGN